MNKKGFSTIVVVVLLVLGAMLIFTNFTGNAILLSPGTYSPAVCSGQWNNCANAFADGTPSSYAEVTNVSTWSNYSFAASNSSNVTNVKVRVDWWGSGTGMRSDIRVSNNGGSAYGAAHTIGGNTNEQTYYIDVTNDFSWNATGLSDSNFRVSANCWQINNKTGSSYRCRNDWIPVILS